MPDLLGSRWATLFAGVALLCSVACKPEIGDDCQLSTDCSSGGERLCDTTQPGGYCTIFNCEPDSCPEEAICVGFNSRSSTNPACDDPLASTRFYRSFCMYRCDDDDDCRDEYECIDMNGPGGDALGAVVVEKPPANGKVCAVPPNQSTTEPSTLPPANVCQGGPPDTGSGGQAGSGGGAGQAGAGPGGAGGASGSTGSGGSAGASGSSGSAGNAGAGGA